MKVFKLTFNLFISKLWLMIHIYTWSHYYVKFHFPIICANLSCTLWRNTIIVMFHIHWQMWWYICVDTGCICVGMYIVTCFNVRWVHFTCQYPVYNGISFYTRTCNRLCMLHCNRHVSHKHICRLVQMYMGLLSSLVCNCNFNCNTYNNQLLDFYSSPKINF